MEEDFDKSGKAGTSDVVATITQDTVRRRHRRSGSGEIVFSNSGQALGKMHTRGSSYGGGSSAALPVAGTDRGRSSRSGEGGLGRASSVPAVPRNTPSQSVVVAPAAAAVAPPAAAEEDEALRLLCTTRSGSLESHFLSSLPLQPPPGVREVLHACGRDGRPARKLTWELEEGLWVTVETDSDAALMVEEAKRRRTEDPGGKKGRYFSCEVEISEIEDKENVREEEENGGKPSAVGEREGQAAEASTTGGGSDVFSMGALCEECGVTEAKEERFALIKHTDLSRVKFIGGGAGGDVYMAKWGGSRVAVKALHLSRLLVPGEEENNGNCSSVRRFMAEARLQARCIHPNVVTVYGVCLDGETLQIVTEYMPLGSIGGVLRGGGVRRAEGCPRIPLRAKGRLRIGCDVARGMAYLHSMGVVHFDLKADNCLLGESGGGIICKVCDFGLSKLMHEDESGGPRFSTQSSLSCRGTLAYTAPELIMAPSSEGNGSAMEVTSKLLKVDVFSFGILMWELWTERQPYEGKDFHNLLFEIMDTKGEKRPEMPDKVLGTWIEPPHECWPQLMQRCWSTDPDERPSFSEIATILQEKLEGES